MIPTRYKSTIATAAAPYVYKFAAISLSPKNYERELDGLELRITNAEFDVDDAERAEIQAKYEYFAAGCLFVFGAFSIALGLGNVLEYLQTGSGLVIRGVFSMALGLVLFAVVYSFEELPELEIVEIDSQGHAVVQVR